MDIFQQFAQFLHPHFLTYHVGGVWPFSQYVVLCVVLGFFVGYNVILLWESLRDNAMPGDGKATASLKLQSTTFVLIVVALDVFVWAFLITPLYLGLFYR